MKKRLLSLVLSLAMVLTMLPATVWAEEDVATLATVADTEITTVSGGNEADNDALFMDYLYRLAGADQTEVQSIMVDSLDSDDYETISHPAMMTASNFSSTSAAFYSKLKERVEAIAAGGGSTVINIVFSKTYTAEELNVPQVNILEGVSGAMERFHQDTGISYTQNGNLFSLGDDLDTEAVLNEIVFTDPISLYWYDKTVGSYIQKGYGYSWDKNVDAPQEITIEVNATYYMCVATEFRPNPAGYYQLNGIDYYCEVDTSKTTAAKSAVAAAQGVVENNKNGSDSEKLRAYLDYICGAVSYNSAALSNTPYGNPWQLIYVFDNNSSTNVVCEGYAKAFKFLCDLSTWSDSDFECILVTGQMDGGTGAGNHMWNLVHLQDGNYLVDPTNCDQGTSGAPDKLFMREWEAGAYDGTYSFTNPSINYTYDDDTKATYTPEELKLKGDPAIPAETSPVDFFADEDATERLEQVKFDGTPVTVYLAVSDEVTLTGVKAELGQLAIEKVNERLYRVTIEDVSFNEIAVSLSGSFQGEEFDQFSFRLGVEDLRPGLVWHWLDWRDDSWQENGTDRYWEDMLGNEPMGYLALRDGDGETRLSDEEVKKLNFGGLQYALEKEEGESQSRIHLLFDQLGYAAISLPEGQSGVGVAIRVMAPEIGFYADAEGKEPIGLWVLDGTNDTIYLRWGENIQVTSVERDDGNGNVVQTEMNAEGRYVKVTMEEYAEDWLNFSVRGTDTERPDDGEKEYWVYIRMVDRRPGLRFFWVDYDWENEQVNDVREDEPQSRMVMSPDETWIVQLAYYDGEKYQAVSQDYTLPDGLLRLERTVDGQYLALTARDFGSDEISCTVGENVYSLPVYITLPEVGFYRDTQATEKNFLREWDFTGENDVVYLMWREGTAMEQFSVDPNSRTAVQILNGDTMNENGYAAIAILSYADDWIGIEGDLRWDEQRVDHFYARLNVHNRAPGLRYYWVEGDWNREDELIAHQEETPQGELWMEGFGNACIQLAFDDGSGQAAALDAPENVSVSGCVRLEKTVQDKYLLLQSVGFGTGSVSCTVGGKTYTMDVVCDLPELGFYDTCALPEEGSDKWEAEWQAHFVPQWQFTGGDSVVYLMPLHGCKLLAVEQPENRENMDWRATVAENGAYAAFRLNSFSGEGELSARVRYVRDDNREDNRDCWLRVTDAREDALYATADMACAYDKDSNIYWVRDLALGSNVTLQAKVTSDSQGCTYQWYENGFDPERGGHYSELIEGATGLNLTVENLQRNRGFTFRVTRQVNANYTEVCDVVFELCIANDLRFTVDSKAVSVFYGGTVDVKATMEAGEGANADGLFYEWYRRDGDESFGGPDSAMTLDGVTRGGTYCLQVWDCYGNLFDAEGQVEITVLPAQPGRVYLAHTNRDYGDGDVLEIYQGDTIHLGVTANGYAHEGLDEGDLWLCTWDPTELEKLGFSFRGAEGEFGEEFTWKDDFESPYGPYVDTRGAQPGEYHLAFSYQRRSDLDDPENADSYDTFVITIRVKAPEAKTVWNGEEFANGGTMYVRPGQTSINPVADFHLDLINDFALVVWDTESLCQVGFTVDDEALWIQYQGENTAVPNISVPENLAPGTKATLTWRIVRGSTSPAANGENKWEDAETVYTYTVTIATPERGNLNGVVNALGQAVDTSDMQCLFEYLSLGQINSRLVKDDNDPAQVAYFRTVADVNKDALVNILDYQALYEMVKAQ